MSDKFIEQLFSQGIEEWQKKIIRDALQDEYIHSVKESYTGIIDLMEEYIGEKVSRKIISQFLGHTTYYESEKGYDPQKRSWIIILKYLMKVKRLTPEHFKNERLSDITPAALAEFFGNQKEMNDFSYAGNFLEETTEQEDGQDIIGLIITPSSSRGYYEVKEIIQKKKYKDHIEEEKGLPIQVAKGWAVLSVDKKFFIYLKQLGEPIYYAYISMFEPLMLPSSQRVQSMLLFNNRNVIKNWDGSDYSKAIINHMVRFSRNENNSLQYIN